MKPKKMTRDDIETIARQAVEDAVEFIAAEIEPSRSKAQKYFDGKVDISAEAGRSQVVATKVRDSIRAVMPSLARVFLAADTPVEFTPKGPEDVASAEQATRYIAAKFDELGGYRKLVDVFQDALVKKNGFLKVYFDERQEVEIHEYTELSMEEFQLLQSDDVEVLEYDVFEEDALDPMGQPIVTVDAKIMRTDTNGTYGIEAIPPEDFFIDKNATSIEDYYVCGHRSDMRVGDLVEMGFDFEEVAELDADNDDDEAEYERKGYQDEDQSDAKDPSMKEVTVYEAYMKMDVEGIGIPRLYRVILGGSKKQLLDYEVVDDNPFAAFGANPKAHSFFDVSLAEVLINDQDVGTVLIRGMTDNAIMTNSPGYAFDPINVDQGDMMNDELGKLVRTKGSPHDKIMPLSVPFAAGGILPAMQYFDETIENKTGVSRASMGLNPDALQSTTAAGVNATVQAAEEQMEFMARNLAEGGFTRLFKLLFKLISKHPQKDETLRLDGQYIPIDPRTWNSAMDVVINVGLGSNRKDQKVMALRETLQMQQMVFQTYGPNNGMVTLAQIRNTIADLSNLQGLHNVDRHWMPIPPELEQMMGQQQAQQPQQNPNDTLAQAEIAKAQIKAQTDMQRLQMEDDRKRDEMSQKLYIEAAKAISGPVPVQRVEQVQAAPRYGQG